MSSEVFEQGADQRRLARQPELGQVDAQCLIDAHLLEIERSKRTSDVHTDQRRPVSLLDVFGEYVRMFTIRQIIADGLLVQQGIVLQVLHELTGVQRTPQKSVGLKEFHACRRLLIEQFCAVSQ
jgi:hypothetical protein